MFQPKLLLFYFVRFIFNILHSLDNFLTKRFRCRVIYAQYVIIDDERSRRKSSHVFFAGILSAYRKSNQED